MSVEPCVGVEPVGAGPGGAGHASVEHPGANAAGVSVERSGRTSVATASATITLATMRTTAYVGPSTVNASTRVIGERSGAVARKTRPSRGPLPPRVRRGRPRGDTRGRTREGRSPRSTSRREERPGGIRSSTRYRHRQRGASDRSSRTRRCPAGVPGRATAPSRRPPRPRARQRALFSPRASSRGPRPTAGCGACAHCRRA